MRWKAFQLSLLLCRGTDGEKAVLQAIDAALGRASQAEPAFSPEKKKKVNLLDESFELQRSAFMAARAALKGEPCQQQCARVHQYNLPTWLALNLEQNLDMHAEQL